jgi:Caspase domain
MTRSRYVGVGVSTYANPKLLALKAADDVMDFGCKLQSKFVGKVLRNPTTADIHEYLQDVVNSLPEGGDLILYWSGHGRGSSIDGLRLMTTGKR